MELISEHEVPSMNHSPFLTNWSSTGLESTDMRSIWDWSYVQEPEAKQQNARLNFYIALFN